MINSEIQQVTLASKNLPNLDYAEMVLVGANKLQSTITVKRVIFKNLHFVLFCLKLSFFNYKGNNLLK